MLTPVITSLTLLFAAIPPTSQDILDTTRGFGAAYDSAIPPGDQLSGNQPPGNEIVAIPEPPSMNGQWSLEWDDEIGKSLVGQVKACDVKFRSVDGLLTGEFVGPVAGRDREAIFTGALTVQGSGQLLTFKQREQGYTCSYQVFWPNKAEDMSQVLGVWHDTMGRSGNFRLMKYQ